MNKTLSGTFISAAILCALQLPAAASPGTRDKFKGRANGTEFIADCERYPTLKVSRYGFECEMTYLVKPYGADKQMEIKKLVFFPSTGLEKRYADSSSKKDRDAFEADRLKRIQKVVAVDINYQRDVVSKKSIYDPPEHKRKIALDPGLESVDVLAKADARAKAMVKENNSPENRKTAESVKFYLEKARKREKENSKAACIAFYTAYTVAESAYVSVDADAYWEERKNVLHAANEIMGLVPLLGLPAAANTCKNAHSFVNYICCGFGIAGNLPMLKGAKLVEEIHGEAICAGSAVLGGFNARANREEKKTRFVQEAANALNQVNVCVKKKVSSFEEIRSAGEANLRKRTGGSPQEPCDERVPYPFRAIKCEGSKCEALWSCGPENINRSYRTFNADVNSLRKR